MTARSLSHVRDNLVAYLALFVALSGTAYAATALPRNSVGTKQIKKRAVSGKKVKNNTLTGKQIRESRLGQVPLAAEALDADTATTAVDASTVGGQAPSAFLAAGAKAVDADKLDGIDSSVFGTSVIYTGTTFVLRNTTGTEAKKTQGTGAVSCEGTTTDFLQHVDLPQGAKVTKVDWRLVDNAVGFNSGLSLIAYDTFQQGPSLTEDVVSLAATTDVAGRRTLSETLATPHTVDNTRYAYNLVWTPSTCADTMQLVGVAVYYTLP